MLLRTVVSLGPKVNRTRVSSRFIQRSQTPVPPLFSVIHLKFRAANKCHQNKPDEVTERSVLTPKMMSKRRKKIHFLNENSS